jgi:hypothetical protein
MVSTLLVFSGEGRVHNSRDYRIVTRGGCGARCIASLLHLVLRLSEQFCEHHKDSDQSAGYYFTKRPCP